VRCPITINLVVVNFWNWKLTGICGLQVTVAVVTWWIIHSDDLVVVVVHDVHTIHREVEADLGNLQVIGRACVLCPRLSVIAWLFQLDTVLLFTSLPQSRAFCHMAIWWNAQLCRVLMCLGIFEFWLRLSQLLAGFARQIDLIVYILQKHCWLWEIVSVGNLQIW